MIGCSLGSRYSKSGQAMNGIGTSLSPTAEQAPTNGLDPDMRPFQHIQSYKSVLTFVMSLLSTSFIEFGRNYFKFQHFLLCPCRPYSHTHSPSSFSVILTYLSVYCHDIIANKRGTSSSTQTFQLILAKYQQMGQRPVKVRAIPS